MTGFLTKCICYKMDGYKIILETLWVGWGRGKVWLEDCRQESFYRMSAPQPLDYNMTGYNPTSSQFFVHRLVPETLKEWIFETGQPIIL